MQISGGTSAETFPDENNTAKADFSAIIFGPIECLEKNTYSAIFHDFTHIGRTKNLFDDSVSKTRRLNTSKAGRREKGDIYR